MAKFRDWTPGRTARTNDESAMKAIQPECKNAELGIAVGALADRIDVYEGRFLRHLIWKRISRVPSQGGGKLHTISCMKRLVSCQSAS